MSERPRIVDTYPWPEFDWTPDELQEALKNYASRLSKLSPPDKLAVTMRILAATLLLHTLPPPPPDMQ